MLYGLSLPHFGPYADAALLAELAHEAEDSGWDGFFVWDHIGWGANSPEMVDPWIALAVAAHRTKTIKLGPMVTPLPRRRPTKLARETASLDRLSNGRLILGVGTGAGAAEWDDLGEEPDGRVRGAMLDEALEVLAGLWSGEVFSHHGEFYHIKEAKFTPTPVQQPRIPVWVAGTWPTKTRLVNDAPFRRAAQWDGVFPIARDLEWNQFLSPQHLADIVALIRSYRRDKGMSGPYDVVHSGGTPGEDKIENAETAAAYAEAGATWWMENILPNLYGWTWQGNWPLEAMRNRIRQGPPK
jgi:alkanesulfonate monooxygenase SsuD/methylene tetrahydromethanopterin reductase-like flavin-dependent oxidoreductase (luciferase family)